MCDLPSVVDLARGGGRFGGAPLEAEAGVADNKVMKLVSRGWRVLALMVLVMASVGGNVHGDNDAALGNNRLKLPKLGNTMNFDSCEKYSWAPNPGVVASLPRFHDGHPCCTPIPVPCGDDLCCPTDMYNQGVFDIDYWEPSALIEVSCRNGYSALKPGGITGYSSPDLQSCQGLSAANGSKRWFFEARVWAIDGYSGRARAQSSGGSTKAEETRACSMAGDDTTKNQFWGYGVKYDKFTKGPPNGPGESWEAYISDSDKSWAQDTGNLQKPPTQQKCQHGDVDVEKCWGNMGGAGAENGGWVSAPNQTVGAALVAWRAHAKAKGKVSPAGEGGYKMNLDYPFLYLTSPYAKSMGMQGGDEMKGSKCFVPGDAGPEWYSHNEENMTVDKVIQETQNFRLPGLTSGTTVSGTALSAADVQPGLFIFTVWVHTHCQRFKISGGKPGPLCYYRNGS
jgi:hypothetical protein